jgi:hypothetical protein
MSPGRRLLSGRFWSDLSLEEEAAHTSQTSTLNIAKINRLRAVCLAVFANVRPIFLLIIMISSYVCRRGVRLVGHGMQDLGIICAVLAVVIWWCH